MHEKEYFLINNGKRGHDLPYVRKYINLLQMYMETVKKCQWSKIRNSQK